MRQLLPAPSAVHPAPGWLHLPEKLLLPLLLPVHLPLPALPLPPVPLLLHALLLQLRYAPPLPELPVPIQMLQKYPVPHMRSGLSDPVTRNHIPAHRQASWPLPVLHLPDLQHKLLHFHRLHSLPHKLLPASGLPYQELPEQLLFWPLPALQTLLPQTRYRSPHIL